jgi:4-carboxymuconolactone decarboxylase
MALFSWRNIVKFRNLTLIACAFLSAAAQDRMPPIPRDKMTEAQRKAADELIAGRRGAVIGPFIPSLRSPEFMSRLQKLGEYVRFENTLGPRLTEFVILLTARQWTQQYEFDAHQPLALKAGVEKELITAIAEGRRPLAMAEDQQIAYDFCMELQRNKSVSDATYARAAKTFGEQGIIDLIGISGYYSTIAMIMNVARTPLAPGKTPLLPALP